MARHFNNKCRDPHDPHKYLAMQITEPMTRKMSKSCYAMRKNNRSYNFLLPHDMNILLDLCSRKHIDCHTK